MATDLVIGIGAEYIGKPAFDKAEKSVNGLGKSVNKLGKIIGGAFAINKIYAFSKASVKAFQEDQNSAKALTASLNNLGLAFEDDRAKRLIENLQATYKVADDQLRPALSSLIRTTGSLSKSQSILETALNISAGTGENLESVVKTLSQAYVGNTKGLKNYNIGLTNAELKTKSFADIQKILNAQFADQALIKAADPFVALGIAADNAKETIGKSLVKAINDAIGAGTGVNDISTNIDHLAERTSRLITILGKAAGLLNFIGKNIFFSTNAADYQDGIFSTKTGLQMPRGSYTKGGGKAIDLAAAARKKAEDEAIKRNKELLALSQKQARAAADAAKAKKEQAILEKVNQLFNMDLIQNVAALQGKLTEDETLRLKTQQAIILGNADSAGLLAMKLLEAQRQAMLARQTDPFLGWSDSANEALKAILEMIAALKLLGATSQQTKNYAPTISTAAGTYYMSSTGVSSLSPDIGTSYEYFAGLSGGKYGSTPTYTPQMNIVVSVDPNNGNINAATQNTSLNGTTTTASRLNPISGGL